MVDGPRIGFERTAVLRFGLGEAVGPLQELTKRRGDGGIVGEDLHGGFIMRERIAPAPPLLEELTKIEPGRRLHRRQLQRARQEPLGLVELAPLDDDGGEQRHCVAVFRRFGQHGAGLLFGDPAFALLHQVEDLPVAFGNFGRGWLLVGQYAFRFLLVAFKGGLNLHRQATPVNAVLGCTLAHRVA